MISARGDIQSDSVHNHQNGQFVMSESTMMSEHVLGREQAASGEPRYTAGPISGDQSAEIVSFDPFESAKRVCSCFKRQLDNMTQLYNLGRYAEKARFDLCMQCTTNTLASCRAMLQCKNCLGEPENFLLALSAVRLVFNRLDQQASTGLFRDGLLLHSGTNGTTTNVDYVQFRCGDFSMPPEQSAAMCDILFRIVLRDCEETLKIFRRVVESGAGPGNGDDQGFQMASIPTPEQENQNQASFLSAIDARYMSAVISQCEESLATIMQRTRNRRATR